MNKNNKDYDENLSINLNKSLGLFVLLVCGNYIGELMGCKLRHILHHNILVKHLLGLMCLFFFITIITPVKNEKLHFTAYKTIGLYIAFVLTTKTHYQITILIYSFVFGLYILNLVERDYYSKKEYPEKVKQRNIIKKIYNSITIIIIGLILIGFVFYYNDKLNEYGPEKCRFIETNNCFSLKRFLLGRRICRNKN